MPLYTYECTNCLDVIEELHSITAEPLRWCKKCSLETLKQVLQPSIIKFGSFGFHTTDYDRKTTK